MSRAQWNAKGITRVLRDRTGYADLFRTVTAGPSGQRADKLIARIRDTTIGSYEVRIIDLTSPYNAGEVAGYAHRTIMGDGWHITSYDDFEGFRYLGSASSLALGADILINGQHAAMGRHDSRRISGGTWRPFVMKEL